MSRQHRGSPQRHPHSQRGADCYPTCPEAAWGLLQVEQIPDVVADVCCGTGNIVDELRRAGRTVHASDLIDYGCPDSRSGVDFLQLERLPAGCQAIICNPPYRLAGQFVAQALQLCPSVMMLLRWSFIESRRRSNILDDAGLARIHVFKRRLPMMHRHNWAGPRATSQVPYAWFVWQRGYRGPIILYRIDYPEDGPDYDLARDIRESVHEGFRAVRIRQAAGGAPWAP
jgi:hypothetical protein